MSERDFEAYTERTVPRYAEENVTAGAWDPAVAQEKAEHSYRRLLPDGIATENHHLLNIIDDEHGSCIGMVWFRLDACDGVPSAFICDFEVFDEFRRRGYGRQALLALEDRLHEEGVSRVSLHVFAHNEAARSLYERLGYVSTGIHMTKRLGSGSSER